MRNRLSLLLACCIGLCGGLSCTTHKTLPSPAQPPAGQAAADAKAKKQQAEADAKAAKEAAENARKAKAAQAAEQAAKTQQDRAMAVAAAKAKKEKDAEDAKALKKAQADAARQAKGEKANASKPATAPVPTANSYGPLTEDRKLNNLARRYENDELTPLRYQIERAKIIAEP